MDEILRILRGLTKWSFSGTVSGSFHPDLGVRIHGSGGSVSFSGTAYVNGIKSTGLNSDASKLWVKCDLVNSSCSEETGPPDEPLPEGEEWYEKANTYGDIHIVGRG